MSNSSASSKIHLHLGTQLMFSTPRRLGDTTMYSQRIWDPVQRKGYIGVLSLEEVIQQKRRGLIYTLDKPVKKVE